MNSPGAAIPSGFSTQTVSATGRLRANSAWALRALALAGQGIALVPRFLVHDDLAEGRLVTVLADVLDADLDVMALLPPGRKVSAKARAFVDFIAARLRAEPDRGVSVSAGAAPVP